MCDSVAQIVLAIASGAADEGLPEVYQAYADRSKLLRKTEELTKLSELSVGDYVRLKGLRPKYLAGRRGTVEKISGSQVIVIIDEADRFGAERYVDPNDGEIQVKANMLEVV